jgi:hypothetical protein
MWFSFSTNILIFVTALILFFVYRKGSISLYYQLFVALIGLSSFLAAFGHLPIIEKPLSSQLLYFSRLLNFASVFAFISGTLMFFNYWQSNIMRLLNVTVFFVFVTWLSFDNVFTPVIIYSLMGILVIGVWSYVNNYNAHRDAAIRVIFGIVLLLLSAIVFTLFKSNDNSVAADIGHVLVSLSLVTFMAGFNKLKVYEN